MTPRSTDYHDMAPTALHEASPDSTRPPLPPPAAHRADQTESDHLMGPLSPAHTQQIHEARQRAGKLRGALRLASFNAWSFAILAGLSLPFAIFDATTLVAMIVLAATAFVEFRGRRLLMELNPRGLRLLGWNQIVFMAAVIIYCAWSLYAGLTGPSPYADELASTPQLSAMLGPIDELTRTITVALYAGVIALTVVFQGFNAWYYFSRVRYLHDYLAHTPTWIVELQLGTQIGARAARFMPSSRKPSS